MLRISIDGACRRNGKPDCVSAGGIFIQHFTAKGLDYTRTLADYELHSTNQRGEMIALLSALSYINAHNEEAQIITDSEYLFNAMTKNWTGLWARKGWVTSTGESVKNRRLWEHIHEEYSICESNNLEVVFYHIKGHVIPFGKVTASTLLKADPMGKKLMQSVYDKYDTVLEQRVPSKMLLMEKANKLSLKNNGFDLTPELLRDFVVSNTMADIIATECVEAADTLV